MQKTRDSDSIPGSGRSPGGGHGNPFQYSCLETPMDRWDWWATVHRAAKSWTRLKQFRMHTSLLIRHPIPPRPAGLRQRQKDKAGQPAGVHSIDTVNVRCVHRTLSPPTGDILSLYCFFQLISYLLITLPSLVFLLAGIQMVKGASYFWVHRSYDLIASPIPVLPLPVWLWAGYLNFFLTFVSSPVNRIMRICLKGLLHRKSEFEVLCFHRPIKSIY